MQIQHFHATATGGSCFGEVEITLANKRDDGFGNIISASTPFASPRVAVVELPVGMDQDWHGAPERQLVFILEGRVEVETTDGEKRSWGQGEFFLADDTTGQGHKTRTVGGRAVVLFAPIAADFALEKLAHAAG
jgi:hypothetical protein